MKKFISAVLAAVLVVSVISLTSCGKQEFGVTDSSEKYMIINAENAGTDLFFMSGSLEVEEGEQIEISSNLEKGRVEIDIIGADGMDNIEELPDADIEPVSVMNASGTDKMSFETNAGSYMVKATVLEKATGTIEIHVIQGEKQQWNTAESTDDAGKKAGVGDFIADPSGTSLGNVISADYAYMEGVAEAHYGIAAVEMFVRKGLTEAYGEDVSFDDASYAYEWTQDIDGTQVKCWGNREGEATKTIWTSGEYSYAICAYGAGGDDDYGLKADDVAQVFRNVR